MATLEALNVDSTHPFNIKNIPFGVFSTKENSVPRPGTRIGDQVLDLNLVQSYGLFDHFVPSVNGAAISIKGQNLLFSAKSLNAFASLDRKIRVSVREKIIELLFDRESALYTDLTLNTKAFVSIDNAIMHLPMEIGGFADFLTSKTHAENCAHLASQPLHPSFLYFPTAYNGRASSLLVSGTPIPRPHGMIRNPNTTNNGPPYTFLPTARLDFELEMGILISNPIPFAHAVTAEQAAEHHIFGLVLLNDWSARDVQFAEMVPLGPFNGKSAATSISPWVIMPEALGHCTSASVNGPDVRAAAAMPGHLRQEGEGSTWDVELEVRVVRDGVEGEEASVVCRSNLREGYWSPGQMVAHQASTGCGLATGDLIGTGTLSGLGHTREKPTLGCLHELTRAGTESIRIPGGEGKREMMWLEDGDEVVFEGWAGKGKGRIGFGELRGKIVAGDMF